MDFLPKELSQEQASLMKNILDKQLSLIQNDQIQEQNSRLIPQSYLPTDAYESEGHVNMLKDEIFMLQSKIQNLERKFNKNQGEQSESQIKSERLSNQQSLKEDRNDILLQEDLRFSQKYGQDSFQNNGKRQEFLESLEHTFSPSIHSEVSKNSQQASPKHTISKKLKNKPKSTQRSYSNVKTVDRMKQELAQERSKRIKVQREVDNLRHTLRVKDSVANQYNQLQEQYKELYFQFERSEKIRLQQKELLAALKEELISLREDNEELSQKVTPRVIQKASVPAKKKKVKKVSDKK